MSDQQADNAAEVQEARAQIALGLDVQAFMSTTTGRYLLARANAERDATLEELAAVDPEDPKAIRDLQLQVRVCERVLSWLGDAVSQGENAEKAYLAAHGE